LITFADCGIFNVDEEFLEPIEDLFDSACCFNICSSDVFIPAYLFIYWFIYYGRKEWKKYNL